MKLLYYLPSFGSPDEDKKYEILLHNLTYIYNTINEKFDVCINFYIICDKVKQELKLLPFINNLYFYEKKGVLTELFLTNPDNKIISNFDYILFVLDDVKIIDINLKKMIEVKQTYNIEILSPKILKSTHSFMNSSTDLTINNFLEVYLLLLTPVDFQRFCSIHTIKNKWMWGVDFLFGFYKIKTGVLNCCVAEHMLPSKSIKGEAYLLMNDYIRTHTNYQCLDDIRKAVSPIIETIKL